MCFHFNTSVTQQKKDNPDFDFSGVQSQNQLYFNGFTFPECMIVNNLKTKKVETFKWGLIPHWSKDDKIQKYTLNARIETLHKKPSFRNYVNQRCLVLANSFFEWQWSDPKGKKKQKYEIGFSGEQSFYLGGIWSEWADRETGEVLNTFSIVTTKANELMSKIHNTKERMPIVLDRSSIESWMSDPIDKIQTANAKLIANKA